MRSPRSGSLATPHPALSSYGSGMPATPRLSPGDVAPAFTLEDDEGKPVSLSNFLGRKVVLYVYPAAMTPGCTKQACDFRDSLEGFVAAGLAVIGLSPSKPAKLATF